MFGIGGPELVVIVLLLLIFVGPEKLPEVMRTVGGGLRDLRRAANLAQAEVQRGLDELSREVDEVTRDVRDAAQTVAQDVHSIGRDVQEQVQAAAESEPPAAPMVPHGNATPDAETIEVVRRKSAPVSAPQAPRLESAPPWAVAAQDIPPELPQPVGLPQPVEVPQPSAVQRPRFNPPSLPSGVLARDSAAAVPVPVPTPAPAAETAAALAPAAQDSAGTDAPQHGLADASTPSDPSAASA